MTDKRNATQVGWVPATPQLSPNATIAPSHDPTHKGEISGWRVTIFAVLSVLVALALGYLASVVWGVNVALAVGVIVMLAVFVPLFAFDMLASTGYLHRRIEAIVRLEEIALAQRQADSINAEQQEQLEQLWTAYSHLDERLKAVEVIRVQSRDGVRHVPKHDNIDVRISAWLSQTMFDVNGQLVGCHASGHLKSAYPFKGEDDESRQAHARLIRAGLVGKSGNNYTWTGPLTLSETRKRLQPVNGQDTPEVG